MRHFKLILFLFLIYMMIHFPFETKSNEVIITKKEVYKVLIYSTHQEESYVDFNIFDASKYLQSLLISKGILCDVIEDSVVRKAISLNMNYNDYYKVSSLFLNERLKQQSYDLVIDLHRDSVSKEYTTINQYAKMMLVVGNLSCNKDNVVNLSNCISEKLNEKVNQLSRGLYYWNNYFNQQYHPNLILVEVGGIDNKKVEIMNSLVILADVLEEVIYEKLSA